MRGPSCCGISLPLSSELTACDPSALQAIAEFFTACGEVIAVRLSAAAGQKKAWVEFNAKDAARSAREYDNTVRISAPAVRRPVSLFLRRWPPPHHLDCRRLLATLPTVCGNICLPLAMPCPPTDSVTLSA